LGLGSVGSVFLDQRVASAFFVPPVLGGPIAVLLIFFLRGVCFRLQKLPESTMVAVATMVAGLASTFKRQCVLSLRSVRREVLVRVTRELKKLLPNLTNDQQSKAWIWSGSEWKKTLGIGLR